MVLKNGLHPNRLLRKLGLRERPRSPRELFGELFVEAQLAHVSIDNKSFADAEPRMTARAIRSAYKRQRAREGEAFSIGEFARTFFLFPEQTDQKTPREHKGERENIRVYIEETWDALTREPDEYTSGSLLSLPRRYIVPGGRFRELYYWDSYFTMIGLIESGRMDLTRDMVENFASLIRRYGHIPNGTRTYYLTRSNQPYFALMVQQLADHGDTTALSRYLTVMEAEYAYWMRGSGRAAQIGAAEHVVRMPDGELLNRYWDESDLPREEMLADDVLAQGENASRSNLYRELRTAAESGWDFSSRYLDEPTDLSSSCTTSIVPVDLNILLALYEDTIARAYDAQGRAKRASTWRSKALARTDALRKYLWSEEHGWYMDYHLGRRAHTTSVTLGGAYALWGRIATESQAKRMVETFSGSLLRDGGAVTTAVRTGQQWDAPNGWAPLQYVTVVGLEQYGYSSLAEDVARRWVNTVKRMYKRFGALLEKYNVEDPHELAGGGEYAIQDGFGWTNAVTLHFMNRYGIPGKLEDDVS